MVSPAGVSATQSVPVQQQPTFSSGAEARARTEEVQPREAPAADAQRADSKQRAREEENKQVEFRDRRKEDDARAEQRRADNDSRRGSLLDVSA